MLLIGLLVQGLYFHRPDLGTVDVDQISPTLSARQGATHCGVDRQCAYQGRYRHSLRGRYLLLPVLHLGSGLRNIWRSATFLSISNPPPALLSTRTSLATVQSLTGANRQHSIYRLPISANHHRYATGASHENLQAKTKEAV